MIQQHIAVNTDKKLACCQVCSSIQTDRFALILGVMNDAERGILLRKFVQKCACLVRTAIVHGNNLVIRIRHGKQMANGFSHIVGFVITGDNNADFWPREQDWLAVLTVFIPHVVPQGSEHPYIGDTEWVVVGEASNAWSAGSMGCMRVSIMAAALG